MIIVVKVIANSSQDKIVGWEGGMLKIKCKAEPKKGKANEAVICLLAMHYGVSKSAITIVGGKNNSKKMIQIVEE